MFQYMHQICQLNGFGRSYDTIQCQNVNIYILREYRVTWGSTFHKCKVNTAHQMELFVIRVSKRPRGRMCKGRLEGGGGEGEHILLTPKYLDQFLTVLHATFTTGLIFVRQLKQGTAPYLLIETIHTPKYLDQFLTVLLATFTTGMCSFGQNIGLLPIVSIVSQK